MDSNVQEFITYWRLCRCCRRLAVVNYQTKRGVWCVHMGEDARGGGGGGGAGGGAGGAGGGGGGGSSGRSMEAGKKAQALRAAYRSLAGHVFPPPAMPPEDTPSDVKVRRDSDELMSFVKQL